MWCVVHVKDGGEEHTEDFVAGLLPESLYARCFHLIRSRRKKYQGQWTLITSRLFPGYVFVETERIDDFCMRLKRIDAMAKLLCTGEDMTLIHLEEESYLRLLGGEEHIVEYSEGYLEGEKLIVTSGAMKNFRGTVKKVLRHKRLVVLEVPLMGRIGEVTVGLGIVKRQ